ncbi:STAS domain-containing protein [uncultured Ferrimonas sp.]|uniref:STAS domain-containing protein n=1 Tax=uncultured Ferrimonas sp. TaxID=432640 RepID=UPI00261E24E5|nr:STAS domain-containing protein [uncultured Ferrimonas sp.]
MSLTINWQPPQLQLQGDLTTDEVTRHWPVPQAWLTVPVLTLDLSQLAQIDSAGLAWLLELESLQRRANGTLEWHHCPERLQQLMTLYDLSLKQQRLEAKNNA